MRIVIPGGSGQVGGILARHFHANGHEVIVLSRHPYNPSWKVIQWDGRTVGTWAGELERSDVCINLSGSSVNCRYNTENRRAIHDSRIQTTLLLNQVIASLREPPPVWLNANTATIYRHALDREMDEASGELGGNEPGAPDTWNFSIDVAKEWEKAFFSVSTQRTRKIALRSAMTFSPDRGGVFDVLLGLVRCGLGGTQGSGKQFVSWIHETDFVRAVEFLIEREDFSGVVNLASPNPQPRIHEGSARSVGHAHRTARSRVDTGVRDVPFPERIGTCAEKSTRRAGSSAGRSFPVPFPRMADSGARTRSPLETDQPLLEHLDSTTRDPQ